MTWQINSTVFNVWNATRVGRRTDTFSPLHGGYDTVNKTPRAATSRLCWQIMGFCSPTRIASLREAMSVCIDEVSQWMRSNRLQLNTTKTDILWCGAPPADGSIRYRRHQHGPATITLWQPDQCWTSIFTWTRMPPWLRMSPSPHQPASQPCARSVLIVCLVLSLTTGLRQRHVSRFTKLHVRHYSPSWNAAAPLISKRSNNCRSSSTASCIGLTLRWNISVTNFDV